MSALSTIFVGALTAVAGAFGTGVLASLFVEWFRIPSREGASGYYIIFLGLLGGVAGLIIGIVCARVVAAQPAPTFLRALMFSVGAVAGLLSIAAALGWLSADFPPKLQGHRLVIEAEVMLPPGADISPTTGGFDPYYTVLTASSGKRFQSAGSIDTTKATKHDGRWLMPASVPLHTSDPGKSLGFAVGDLGTQYFDVPVGSKPTVKDMEWSAWVSDVHDAQLKPIPAASAITFRYRVQFYVEPPPPPESVPVPEKDPIAEENAAAAALTANSSFDEWLALTHYSKTEAHRKFAANTIALRADVGVELSRRIASEDHEVADLALRAIAQMDHPPLGMEAAILDLGRKVIVGLEKANAIPVAEDPSYKFASEVWLQFVSWIEGARTLQGRGGLELRPTLLRMQELARVRKESDSLKDIVRMTSFYLNEYGTAPLASPWVEKTAGGVGAAGR